MKIRIGLISIITAGIFLIPNFFNNIAEGYLDEGYGEEVVNILPVSSPDLNPIVAPLPSFNPDWDDPWQNTDFGDEFFGDNSDDENEGLTILIPSTIGSRYIPVDDKGGITYDDSFVGAFSLQDGSSDAIAITNELANKVGDVFNKLAEVGAGVDSVMPALPQAPQYNVTQSQDDRGNLIADQWDIAFTDDTSGLKYTGVFTVDMTTTPGAPEVTFNSHKISYGIEDTVGYIDFETNGKDGNDEEYLYSKITEVEKDNVTTATGASEEQTVGYKKDVEKKENGNIFEGQVTEDGNKNVTGGSGTLTLADGTEKEAEVHGVYTLDNEGHLTIFQILGTHIDSDTQIWVDDATLNYDGLEEVNNRGLDKDAFGNILNNISSNEVLPFTMSMETDFKNRITEGLSKEQIELVKAMKFSYVQDASDLSPQDLGYSAIVDELGVKNEVINVGDIVVEIDSNSLPYTLEQIKAAAVKAGVDISDQAALKSFTQQLNLRTISQNKLYFDVDEGNNLLYLHQIMSGIELSDAGELQLGAEAGDNHLWYSDYGEIADGMNIPASRLESSIVDYGGNVQVQVSKQMAYIFTKIVDDQVVPYMQYRDVGTFSVYRGTKDEASGAYSLNPFKSFEGVDYRDTDGDGVYDTKVYDKMTRVFAEPVQELLSSEEMPRNVAFQETTGYTLDLTTGKFSEKVRQLDAAGNILYEHDRKAVMSGGRIISGDDTTKYYIYDESGNLAREISVNGHYTYDSVTGTYSYDGVTVDGKPAQTSYFQSDGTGVWKLFAQSQGVGTNGSSNNGVGGSSNGNQPGSSNPPNVIPPTINKVRNALSDYVFKDRQNPVMDWVEESGGIPKALRGKYKAIDEQWIQDNKLGILKNQGSNLLSYGLSEDQISGYMAALDTGGEAAARVYLTSLGLLTDEQINGVFNITIADAQNYFLKMYNYTAEEIDKLFEFENDDEKLAYLMNEMGLDEDTANEILAMETEEEQRKKLEELTIKFTDEQIDKMRELSPEEFLTDVMGYSEDVVNFILHPTLKKTEEILSVIKEAADKIDFDKTLHSAESDFGEIQEQAAQRIKEAVLKGLITPSSSVDEVTEILKSILQNLGIQ